MSAYMRLDVTESNPKAYGKLTQKRAFTLLLITAVVTVIVGRTIGVLRGGCIGVLVFVAGLHLSALYGGLPRYLHYLLNIQGELIAAIAQPSNKNALRVTIAKLARYQPWQARIKTGGGDGSQASAEDNPELHVQLIDITTEAALFQTGIDITSFPAKTEEA